MGAGPPISNQVDRPWGEDTYKQGHEADELNTS